MGPWHKTSKTHVSHMAEGDFFGNEKCAAGEVDRIRCNRHDMQQVAARTAHPYQRNPRKGKAFT